MFVPDASTSTMENTRVFRDDPAFLARKRAGMLSTTDKRTATKICRVCGDKAYSYNFNVITCESCKAFFRRNANKEKVGMKKEWIMSEEARLEKKQRVQENRERRLAEAATYVQAFQVAFSVF
ncbi:unnamed protein product [Gongylonema pulchrum]|uniref:Nuclear receptor domain-containing protein n=1 Tax=Gongylonema pulchrum TaxID=637853 RepID=A0A183DXK4_9BILA|nr:unnamed protein product [Gongylonema pulchrum]VDN22314.1 unnamed protein product [Gongylonema pulchrum]